MPRLSSHTIMGVHAPPARLTRRALWLLFTRIGLPILGITLLLDLAIRALFGG